MLPTSGSRLCSKGSAGLQLTTRPSRCHQALYRRLYGTSGESLPIEQAMDMIAAPRAGWECEQEFELVACRLEWWG